MIINPLYSSDARQEWKNSISDHFSKYKDYQDPVSHSSLTCSPFRVVTLPNFISQEKIIDLTNAVKKLPFNQKSNDLYEFYQSNELKYMTQGVIAELAQSLKSEEWITSLSQITGTQLSGTLDMAAQEYRQGGYLLCHDDDMGQDEDARLIAFILYLTDPDWTEEDGGHLQLYDTDEKGQPGKIIRSILPTSNTFAFFSLSRTSYHRVQEVFSKKFNRYSITGWFRGTRKTALSLMEYQLFQKSVNQQEWINPVYLKSSNMAMLQGAFCDQAYLVLREFIQPQLFKELMKAAVKFTHVGPANVQSFSKLYKCDDIWTQILSWFQSEQFKHFLESITGLNLSVLTDISMRKFSIGDYTLVHDQILDPLGLDVIFSFPSFAPDNKEWNDSWGGQLQYVYEQDSIFTHTPQRNELVLVYRSDHEVHKFVKYINRSSCGERQELVGVYLEQ
jgi:Rps23 Pro-64 3,4-dihydroxylase Tpa1-like proline 4-hydroxylase